MTFRHFQDIYHHAYRDYLPVDPTDPILALHSRAPRGSAVTTTIPNAPMPDAEVAASLDGVRAAERHAVEARLLRDDAIRQAKEAGASYAQVAEAAGLTRAGVQTVVRRGRAG